MCYLIGEMDQFDPIAKGAFFLGSNILQSILPLFSRLSDQSLITTLTEVELSTVLENLLGIYVGLDLLELLCQCGKDDALRFESILS